MTGDSDGDGPTLVVTGATGRMGSAVIQTAGDDDRIGTVVGVSTIPGEASARARVRHADDLAATIEEFDADALVDFTVPDSSVAYVETATSAGVACVVGTTGFSEAQLERLRAASENAPVLEASNFAPGVQVLYTVAAEVAEKLPEYDVEITETYSNQKRDAPSGTVGTLLDRIEAVRGDGDRVYGRHGETVRSPGEIGVHCRRAGDVTSETELLFAANHEVLTITQRAEDRSVFAAGAVTSALALVDEPPGWYDVGDVLG